MSATDAMDSLQKIKSHFPIFNQHPTLVYLDNASTTQTPQAVLDAMNGYYTGYRANTHRGLYDLSQQATSSYEQARADIATFIGAEKEEIIFTAGATHGLNLLAYQLGKNLTKKDNIVLTRLEHHANLIPWQQVAKRTGAELRFIELDQIGGLSYESWNQLIDEQTKIVSITALSNALGTITPYPEIFRVAKVCGATTILDAAQLVAHYPIDIRDRFHNEYCDYLAFSGHKMYGPTGIGVLYGRKEKLEQMEPFFFGGDMIEAVNYHTASWAEAPWKFEAGTQHIAGAIGLAAATRFIAGIGWADIAIHEEELTMYLMKNIPEYAAVIGPAEPTLHGGIVSILINGVHPHDTAEILSRYGVCVRAGYHCAEPLMKHLGVPGTVRVSVGIYNTKDDIDAFLKGLEEAKKLFNR